MPAFHDLKMNSITGDPVSFDQYKGQVCLIVNLASQWGLTPQYAGLRALHNDNKDNGFTVLGFPCNQFGEQEPGTDEEILEFAQTNFDANFPMFAKIEVNGDGACELYQELKRQKPGDITWNFEKFLVG